MNTKKFVSNDKTYYAKCVYSPNNGGYYCEIWQIDVYDDLYTGICKTEQEAWEEAESIILMEAACD